MSEAREHAAWIIASNGKTFDAERAFAELLEIDWSETATARIGVGDRVFLYATAPRQQLTHECLVVKTGVAFDDIIDDTEFWLDRESLAERSARSWMRLRLVHSLSDLERERLTLPILIEHGLAAAPQGRVRVPRGVLAHIEAVRTVNPDALQDANGLSPAEPEEVGRFLSAVAHNNFAVPDKQTLATTRGSAQRVFADLVKGNYGYQCALTGIRTRAVLVASHIVPWSVDQNVRLDPSNGICLSSLVDRAFDSGLLQIDENSVVAVAFELLADDPALEDYLRPFHGKRLAEPRHTALDPRHLERRLHLQRPQGGKAVASE